MVASATGTAEGRMISNLTILRPGNGRSSRKAPNFPSTRPSNCDPNVKMKVFDSVWMKAGFWMIWAKFAKPTKRQVGS